MWGTSIIGKVSCPREQWVNIKILKVNTEILWQWWNQQRNNYQCCVRWKAPVHYWYRSSRFNFDRILTNRHKFDRTSCVDDQFYSVLTSTSTQLIEIAQQRNWHDCGLSLLLRIYCVLETNSNF